MTQSNKPLLAKTKSHAFGKDIYWLGHDSNGINYWLEEPKWECGWYWGAGYVETYTNNTNPSIARDINSHQHFNGLWLSSHPNKHGGESYRHQLQDWEGFCTPLTDKEQWELSELMQSVYTLKEAAEYFERGGSHISTVAGMADVQKRKEWAKEINETLLPDLFIRIRSILSPERSI